MNTIINNIGGTVNYHDNHREVTINGAQTNAADIVRSALAEDVEPVTEDEPKSSQYPFVVPQKLEELGLYSLSEFEVKYRKAVKAGANELAPFLKKYRELKVLDMGRRNKKDTYEVLKAFFGDDLDFGYPNFAAYY